MRVYDAILIGAKMQPQAFQHYFDDDGNSCALGAMLKGSGIIPLRDKNPSLNVVAAITEARQRFPELGMMVRCPAPAAGERCFNPSYEAELEVVIAHLNDEHKWDRERIARWIKLELHRRTFDLIFETACQTVEGAFVEILPEPVQA